MRKYLINLSLQQKSNTEVLAFAKTILLKIISNPFYVSPKPTVAELNAMITEYEDALKACGYEGNRGSHRAIVDGVNKRKEIETALTSLSQFCMNTTPYNAEAFLSAGFAVKRPNHKITELGAVINLRQYYSPVVGLNEAKLRWDRPADIGRGIVKTYLVFRCMEADFSTAKRVAVVTKTTFTDKGLTEKNYFYWVIPVSAAGKGVLSKVCSVWVTMPSR